MNSINFLWIVTFVLLCRLWHMAPSYHFFFYHKWFFSIIFFFLSSFCLLATMKCWFFSCLSLYLAMMKRGDSFAYLVLMNNIYLSCLLVGVNLNLHSYHSQGGQSYLLPCQCTWVSIHVLLVWIIHRKDNSWLLVILELCLLGSRHLKCEIAVLWRRELCIYYCQKW